MAESVNLVEQSVNFGRAFKRSNPQPQRGQSQWTDDRIDELRKLWYEGHSAAVIAKTLGGVTRSAVLGKVHRLGGMPGRAAMPRQNKPARILQALRLPPRSIGAPPVKAASYVPAPDPVAPLNVSILDLKLHHCRAVTDDSEWGRARYCAHPIAEGASYCPGHAALFLRAAPKKRGRGA